MRARKGVYRLPSDAAFLLLCAVFLLMGTGKLSAQFYSTGESPARAKWNQIVTANYKVIYPQGTDSLARRYAGLLELERMRVMAGVKSAPKKVPVLLHPYTTISNGMVVWAPKRAEFYTLPPSRGDYYQNWERQLVLHESRHIGQMTHFTKGVFKPLNWIFGEQFTGLGVGIYAPKWLLEGDAVVAETELTDGGRGRSASFMEYYRASFLSGQYRSWTKWRYGSNKRYTPNAYALGYLVNSTARVKSDNYLYTGELMERYVKRFYNPNITNAASRKVAGATPKELLEEGVAMYTQMWKEDYDRRGPFTEVVELAHRKSSFYHEYNSPVVVGEDSVICIKSSYDNPTALVMLCRKEEFLNEHRSGEKTIKAFSGATSNLERVGRKIYWTESVAHARWGKEAYNNLYCYNLDTKEIVPLSKKASFNNPKANASGDLISVVEYPMAGGANVVILKAENGERKATYAAPENGQLTECAWLGNNLYALVVTEKGLGMFTMDLNNAGRWDKVIEEQPKAIRALTSANGKLYFESDIDGVNNIYEFTPQTEQLRRVVNSQFGAHSPYIEGDRVYYSNLYTDGKRPSFSLLAQDPAGQGVQTAHKGVDPYIEKGKICNTYKNEVADKLSAQAERHFSANGIDAACSNAADLENSNVPMAQKRYRKGAHLFRFHSWAPVYYNVDRIMEESYDHFYDVVSLGATMYSQNSLGTAVTMLGYSYHKGYHAAHASFEYSGWLPVFKITADYNTSDRLLYKVEREGDKSIVKVTPTDSPLFNMELQAYIPVNLSSRGWQRGLVPQITWRLENNAFYQENSKAYKNRQKLLFALKYYQMRPVAQAAIFPKWGFSATLSGMVSPDGGENFGSVASVYSYMYMPGFARNHGIRLSGAYQKQGVQGKWMYMDNLIAMPRGHETRYGTTFSKFTADYAVPINLNGLDCGFLAYIKRIQLIPFADFARLQDAQKNIYNLSSYGADVLLDAIVFRIGVPVSFGVRYARTNDPAKLNYIGALGSISLF